MLAGTAVSADEGFTLQGPPKAAWLYFGPKTDGGWTQAVDEARGKIEAALGLKIPYVENVPDDAAIIRPAADKFIQRGFNIILGSSFGYSDTFNELAQKYPQVAFIDISGTKHGPNLGTVYGRSYESQYLCGMIAGAMSKSGNVGFVAPNPLGLVIWTINAYEMGAKKMNPNATLHVVYTGSWNDPVKERAAASALIEQGADVVGQNLDTPTTQIVAQERRVYSTGMDRDLREFAPKATLCSSIWVWDRYFIPELKKVIAGHWKPNPYGDFPGIAGGGTDISCCNSMVPKEVVGKVMAEREEIIKGKNIYTGPLADRDGKERLAAGKVISDADLWQMNWYVKGVVTQ